MLKGGQFVGLGSTESIQAVDAWDTLADTFEDVGSWYARAQLERLQRDATPMDAG